MTTMRPIADLPDIGLAYLHARCTQTDDGCLLWKKQMTNGPITNILRKVYKVRHLVWCKTHERAVPEGRLPMPIVCGNARCINPNHLQMQQHRN